MPNPISVCELKNQASQVLRAVRAEMVDHLARQARRRVTPIDE